MDWYSYTNNSGEKQIVTMILANTTGGKKWAGIFNETEEQIGSFYYNDFAIPEGSTEQEDFEIEAGEQVFVKVKLNYDNSYKIGDNSYYILIQEKQCEHKSVSKNNYVTEYEEIVGDENNHYVIKYYDKICDSCGEITEKKIQDSKYKESHNFDGNYCENCYFEKESVPVENTPEYIDSDYDEPIIDGKTSFGSNVSEWAEKEMEEAYDNELIPEILVGEDLRKRVTRAEFAAIAVQLYEELTGTYASAVGYCPFEDISDNVSYDSIKKAYLLDITMGTEYNIFEPYTLITREQLATMLCRAIKKYSDKNWTLANDEEFYLDISGVPKFEDDADISDYAKPSVYYMAKMGIIAGVDSTHFAPKNTTTYQEAVGYAMATREQAIAISLRIFNSTDML